MYYMQRGDLMNSFTLRDYLDHEYLQKVVSLGDMFEVEIQNIDIETDYVYFTNGRCCQGFFDGRYDKKYFELNSPFGKIRGYCSDLSISFSLAVCGKPYDTISGIYDARFSVNAHIPDEYGFKRHFDSTPDVTCSLCTMANQETLQTILLDGGDFKLTQCYPGSPAPYERLFVGMRSATIDSASKFSLLHTKSLDVSHRSPLTQTRIAQWGNRIQMFEPTELKVECSEIKYGDIRRVDLREVYHLLSQYDDGIKSCLDYFHESLTFEGLDLYQNIVSACFPYWNPGVVSLVTGVQKSAYQKNLGLVSRLNARRR